MSKQWGHGFAKGNKEGFDIGEKEGQFSANYFFADKFRILLSALVVAHKNSNEQDFYSTVRIAQDVISKHINQDSEEVFKVFK